MDKNKTKIATKTCFQHKFWKHINFWQISREVCCRENFKNFTITLFYFKNYFQQIKLICRANGSGFKCTWSTFWNKVLTWIWDFFLWYRTFSWYGTFSRFSMFLWIVNCKLVVVKKVFNISYPFLYLFYRATAPRLKDLLY